MRYKYMKKRVCKRRRKKVSVWMQLKQKAVRLIFTESVRAQNYLEKLCKRRKRRFMP